MDYLILLAGLCAFLLAFCAIFSVWPFERKAVQSAPKEDLGRSFDFPFRNHEEIKDLPDVYAFFIILEQGYQGDNIYSFFEDNAIKFGGKGIYHRYDIDCSQSLFSIARSNYPGTFDPKTLPSEQVKGVALFMKPKLQDDPVFAFDAMVDLMLKFQKCLGGKIKDQDKRVLDRQDFSKMRTEMIESIECA
ncbi:MAG TPA: cell division protein ZipA C-terminal FtsZ-binding domain-containing protein [Gammaproteobacteria bacterium]|nr:cell division protein ZipA C-terminal FtsZ-binding domain-containing protein [Gammaproteobacteria bacterium]